MPITVLGKPIGSIHSTNNFTEIAMNSTTIYGALPTTTIGPFHYLYRITNLVEQKHYYGIRTSKTTLPHHDLGVKYFSSSTDKNFKKDQKEHPENYRYKIIIVSDSRQRVADLEIKIHQKFNVGANPNFYNRVIQSSTGFGVTGRIVVKDNDGNIEYVSITDERYLNGELTYVLKGVNKGKVRVKDQDGNYFSIPKNDPKILSGELIHFAKGTKWINNPELKKNMMLKPGEDLQEGWEYGMKNFNCEGFVPHSTAGRKRIFNPELKKEMMIDPNTELPLGWFYGRLNSKMVITVPKGSKMIHNIELKQNKFIKSDEILPEGWNFGQKRSWD